MIDWTKKKNKGEWSETLCLLKILCSPNWKIFLGDKEGNSTNKHAEVEEIKSLESDAVTYVNLSEEYFSLGNKKVNKSETKEIFDLFFKEVVDSNENPLLITNPKIRSFCEAIKIPSKAPANIKSDLLFKFLNEDLFEGVSIKSLIAGRPSIINSSSHTRISYSLSVNEDFDIGEANPKKVKNTKNGPKESSDTKGTVKYIDNKTVGWTSSIESDTFRATLKRINPDLPEIIGKLVFYSYLDTNRSFNFLFDNYDFTDEDKEEFKRFLLIYSSGVMPKEEWDGSDPCKCTINLSKEGGLVLYRASEENSTYEDYLFQNTSLDSPSSRTSGIKDHVIESNNEFKLLLSLNIRSK
tara:strand:- start:526 stop:1584 length:1059 start_codon:yes stop_codon:yes gene_type:complete